MTKLPLDQLLKHKSQRSFLLETYTSEEEEDELVQWQVVWVFALKLFTRKYLLIQSHWSWARQRMRWGNSFFYFLWAFETMFVWCSMSLRTCLEFSRICLRAISRSSRCLSTSSGFTMDSDGFVRFISVNMFSCGGESNNVITCQRTGTAKDCLVSGLPCTVIWVSMSTGSW